MFWSRPPWYGQVSGPQLPSAFWTLHWPAVLLAIKARTAPKAPQGLSDTRRSAGSRSLWPSTPRRAGSPASPPEHRRARPGSSALWAPMPEREHPAEGAQDGTATPAVRGTTAFDGAHAFDEPTDDREEQIQTQRATDEALHDANVRRPNGSGQCGPSPERPDYRATGHSVAKQRAAARPLPESAPG